jgi:hypothetical protein
MASLKPPLNFKYKFLKNTFGFTNLEASTYLPILSIFNKGNKPLVFHVYCDAHDFKASTFVCSSNCMCCEPNGT